MQDNEVFICSERSARNMAYQGLTKEKEVVEIIDKFTGEELMGLPLKAPLTIY
jgi:leucyl-tRNA synthetase